MRELLTQFIAPIVGLWVIHNAIFSSARFVNKMRETVITGFYEDRPLTEDHKRAIHLDWKLCIAATVLVCSIFVAVVLAATVALSTSSLMMWIGFAIALYPAGCAVGFLICSRTDSKLMSQAIEARSQADGGPEKPAPPPLPSS